MNTSVSTVAGHQQARFAGKVAIVTGAAQGIGRATARRLALEQAQVVLVDRAGAVCESVREEICAEGGSASVVEADLQTYEGVTAMMQDVMDRYQRIDIAVHNVGGTIWAKPFWEYTDSEIEQEISRSLWPTLRCCRAVVPIMINQGFGSIINIGSVATRGIYRVPYSAAKGGVHAMTVCMGMELAEYGVRINCVSPGGVDSSQRVIPRSPYPVSDQEKEWREGVMNQTLRDTPLGRLGSADEIASAVCYFASDEASYITGQVLYVAGGGVG